MDLKLRLGRVDLHIGANGRGELKWLNLSNDLVRRVGEILNVYSMVAPGAHLGIAVSGGADSVVLLHVLRLLLQSSGQPLTVLHVNHKLRSRESDEDEEFVRQLAGSMGLRCLSAILPPGKGNLEQEARRKRQEFFRYCRQEHAIDRIALGHTKGDQVETVLLRFLRGSGTTGLAGMTPVTRSGLIRPLLFTSRSEIREFAEAAKLEWREDSSNNDLRFRRNRVRLLTFPQLTAEYNLALEDVLSRTASLLGSEEKFWNAWAGNAYRRFAKQIPGGTTIPVRELRKLHVAQQRRLIRKCIYRVKNDLRSINISHIEGVLEICNSDYGHDRLTVPGVDAIRSFDTLLLASPAMMQQNRSYGYGLSPETSLDLPFSAGRLTLNRETTQTQSCVTVKNTAEITFEDAFLDLDVVARLGDGSLRIRNWEPGDALQPKGSYHLKKVKTFFQEDKIVLWERRHWPVLVAGGQVIWARGLGADERISPTSATRNTFRIRWERAD